MIAVQRKQNCHISPKTTATLWRTWPMLLALLLFPFQPFPQVKVKNFQRLTLKDGLSDTQCHHIIQDQNGFLWVSTRDGLNKYDGYDFTVYNNHSGNSNRINGNYISFFFEDALGNLLIWYAEQNSFLDVLNPNTNEVQKLEFGEEKGALVAIELTGKGDIYLLFEQKEGLSIYRYQYQEVPGLDLIISIPEKRKSKGKPRIEGFDLEYIDQEGGIFWLMDPENGLRKISRTGRILEKHDLVIQREQPPQCNYYVKCWGGFYCDRQNRLWYIPANRLGVYLHDSGKKKFERFRGLPASGNYLPICEDTQGNLLFHYAEADRNEFRYLLQTDGQILDYSNLPSHHWQENKFSVDFRKQLFKATHNGLFKINLQNTVVQNFLQENVGSGAHGKSMRGIIEDGNGRIIISTEREGWFLLDPQKDIVEPMPLAHASTLNLFIPYICRNLILTPGGKLFGISIGLHGELLKVDPDSRRATIFSVDKFINAMAYSPENLIWVVSFNDISGSETDLAYFDLKSEQFTPYFDKDGSRPIKNSIAEYITVGQNGLLWIATDKGLLSVHRENRESRLYQSNPDKPNSLSYNHVYVIYRESDSLLWLGTAGGGLNRFNPLTGRFKAYTEEQGLSNNKVCGILPDGQGNLWLGTFSGLSYFDVQQETFQNFYTEDGLSHNEFNRFSFYKDKTGRYYFGGMNGVNAFYPEDLLRKESKAQLQLTEFSQFNQDNNELIIQKTNLNQLNEISIPANNKYFTLKFALADYVAPESNQFAWKLEGYDEGWNLVGTNREIRLNNLPAGDYTLKVKGADSNGNWSVHEKNIRITVKEFFYKTGWFLMACLAAFLAAVYGLYRYQLSQAIRMERMRTRISSDLHDEVGGLLSGVALQMELLEYSATDDQKDFIQKIAHASRNAMGKMRDVVWAIDARKDRLEDLLDRMKEAAHELLDPLDIYYRFEVEQLPLARKIPSEVRHNLFLIFKEFLTNTVKHAQATEVFIQLAKRGAAFEMHLQDDGQGLTKNYKTTGQGLANMKMRAEKIGAILEFTQTKGFGIVLRMKAV